MEFLITVRTLIATTVMLFCSLWLARQLKIHRPRLPVSAVLILSLIMLFEPGMLAFLVWVVHDIASVNGGLMILPIPLLRRRPRFICFSFFLRFGLPEASISKVNF